MPLEDLLPPLDDRTYDDIVGEIRTRIARYAPEWRPDESAWTDVNDNDPGVTIAQVFAWLSEMLLFRMNRVPALNYVKFLELIGVELRPAEPARAEVTFVVDPAFPGPIVRVPERAQLSADPGDGGPMLLFETRRALVAFRATLVQAVGFDPDKGHVEFTLGNVLGVQGFQPFGPRAAVDAYLALAFDDALELPSETLDLAFTAAGDQRGVPYASCAAGMALSPSAKLAWEYQDASGWRPLRVLKDDTLAFGRSGHIQLKLPATKISFKSKLRTTDTTACYWIRARIEASAYERPPALLAIRTNTVEAEQAETIRDEVLGGSDGSRDQRFRLANRPVLAGSLELDIQISDDGPERWKEMPDLLSAGPRDPHYRLNRTTGEITTGDGANGRIPVAYLNDPGGNVVARQYRFGGGRRGNVPADTITTVVTSVNGIASVSNFDAAHSGRQEERLEEAKKRAPSTLRSRDRAVTADDFEYLAAQSSSIKRAKALSGFHPDFPRMSLPGVVSVVVVPDADAPNPMPSDGTLRNVCRFLDERRLLTTEVFVLKPAYQKVEVKAVVIALESADAARVHDEVVKRLVDYFHPLRGADDGLGWPFGGTIYYSRVHQRVFSVDGVGSVERLVIALDDADQPECRDVPIGKHGLLYSIEHAIEVRYPTEVDA